MTNNTLQTLKDLRIGCKHCHGGWIDYERARREAINRVNSCHDACSKDFRCKACQRDMWFNGITEEDLK